MLKMQREKERTDNNIWFLYSNSRSLACSCCWRIIAFHAKYAAPDLQSLLHPALTLVYGHPSTTATTVNLYISKLRSHKQSNQSIKKMMVTDAGTTVCLRCDFNKKVKLRFHSNTDWSPVPVNSAVWSYLTSWCIYLNKSTVSTTQSDFHLQRMYAIIPLKHCQLQQQYWSLSRD